MSAPDAFDAPLSRRRRAARPAGRYSRFVNLMKLVLPLMALALLAAIVAWPGMQVAKPGALPLSFTDIKTDDNGLTMASPRYIGTDESGQPFTVTAESATQDKADADRVDMVKPEADMTTKGGTWINVAATTGTYLPKTKMLHLKGTVDVFTDQGWEAHGTDVVVDLQAGTARSDTPVTGQGPKGTLAANGFEATDRGRKLRFEGDVRMTILPAARS